MIVPLSREHYSYVLRTFQIGIPDNGKELHTEVRWHARVRPGPVYQDMAVVECCMEYTVKVVGVDGRFTPSV